MSHFITTIRKYPEWFPCYIPTVHKTLVNVYLSGILRNKVTAAAAAAAEAKSLQSCPTLCDPIDGSPPGSPVPGILQARVLEWVAISFSNSHLLTSPLYFEILLVIILPLLVCKPEKQRDFHSTATYLIPGTKAGSHQVLNRYCIH